MRFGGLSEKTEMSASAVALYLMGIGLAKHTHRKIFIYEVMAPKNEKVIGPLRIYTTVYLDCHEELILDLEEQLPVNIVTATWPSRGGLQTGASSLTDRHFCLIGKVWK
jgi:hypothetical protein